MKVKDAKAAIGDVRSINANLKLLQGRLYTLIRENDLHVLNGVHLSLDEAQEEIEHGLEIMEKLLHKD